MVMLTLCIHHTFSQDEGPVKEKGVSFKGVFDMILEFGGEEHLYLLFSNGETQTTRYGQGLTLTIGGQLDFKNVPAFMLRANTGIKFSTTAAEDASIYFLRMPFSIMPYWKMTEDFRFGLGLNTYLFANLNGDGYLEDERYSSGFQPKVEFGWRWVAVNYTKATFRDMNDNAYDASCFGISFSLVFPE